MSDKEQIAHKHNAEHQKSKTGAPPCLRPRLVTPQTKQRTVQAIARNEQYKQTGNQVSPIHQPQVFSFSHQESQCHRQQKNRGILQVFSF